MGKVFDPTTGMYKESGYDSSFSDSMGITSNGWDRFSNEERLGLLESAKGLGYEHSAATDGLSGWFKDNQSMINTGLGVGGLALGLANYGTMKDWYGKQGQLVDQQIANNAWNMQNKKDIQGAFKTV